VGQAPHQVDEADSQEEWPSDLDHPKSERDGSTDKAGENAVNTISFQADRSKDSGCGGS